MSAVLSLLPFGVSLDSALPSVQVDGLLNMDGTALGSVIGKTEGGIAKFYGIPIGADAGGANRWMPPQPVTSGTYEAFTTKNCVRKEGDVVDSATGLITEEHTEDCLSVDLMSPDLAGSAAACVWIYGGGFTGQDPVDFGGQKPTNFAEQGIVTVWSHYRLNALGWMAHPGLSSMSGYGGSGNYGLMDAINTLDFVQMNGPKFGIDITKVTVFGESAGGAHVAMVLASPESQGKFSRCIIQSPYISFGAANFALKAREQQSELIVTGSGCDITASPTDQIACMRAEPAVRAMITGYSSFNVSRPNAWGPSPTAVAAYEAKYGAGAFSFVAYNAYYSYPVVDGKYLTMPPLKAYAEGVNAAVNVIIGHNNDEYALFNLPLPYSNLWADGQLLPDMSYVRATYTSKIDENSGVVAIMAEATAQLAVIKAEARKYYADVLEPTSDYNLGPSFNNMTWGMIMQYTSPGYMAGIQAYTDAWFMTGCTAASNSLLKGGAAGRTVRRYLFAEPAIVNNGVWLASTPQPMLYNGLPPFLVMGSYHGYELSYVWGGYTIGVSYLVNMLTGGYPVANPSAAQVTLGNTVQGYWTSMMNTGSAGDDWTPATASAGNHMVFSSSLPSGAAMNPCIQAVRCRDEPSLDLRDKKFAFWSTKSGDAALTPTVPCCTDAGTRSLLFGGSKVECDDSADCASKPYVEAKCTDPVVPPSNPFMYAGLATTTSVYPTGYDYSC